LDSVDAGVIMVIDIRGAVHDRQQEWLIFW
jgi:hypothetical protein